MSIFVGLIFGFCAGITDTGELQLGYQSDGKCIVKIEANVDTDGHGPVINQHTLNWEIVDDGAVITIDDQKFFVMKFREA
jgi:hypothetical protein